MSVEITLRSARPGDERLCAQVQTASWRAAFRDILPAEVLEGLTEPSRAEAMYHRVLAQDAFHGMLLLLNDTPHGIAFWSRCRAPAPGQEDAAELVCIHSLPDNWRRGYGSRMMDRVLDEMRRAGFRQVMLWVFAENTRARRFYEAHGFAPAGREQAGFGAREIEYARML